MSEKQERKLDKDTQEAWDYLLEVVGDYGEYVQNIGNLGYSAPNVLYYRDEVQEFLEIFMTNKDVDFKGVWAKVKEYDEILKRDLQQLVDEIGYANFKQYLVINDPPKKNWWWYMYRRTIEPPPQPRMWEFWKKIDLNAIFSEPEEQPESPPNEAPG